MLQVANHAECSKIGSDSAPNGHIFLSVMAAALLSKAKTQNLDFFYFLSAKLKVTHPTVYKLLCSINIFTQKRPAIFYSTVK